ncbi:MAG: peptidyl-prolyl cis-trans isomerase, EpsD family, partial [Lysobacteraceae bacterium]
LEEVAVFLDARNIKYGRAQVTRSTADLNPQLSSKLLSMPKGQLFAVKEGDRAMLISIAEVRDAPVTLAIAGPQIGQYLMNKKNKELAAAEIQRLRGTAKIAYLNTDYQPGATTPGPNAPAGAVPGAAPAAGTPVVTADQAATAVAGTADTPAGQASVAPPVAPGAATDNSALERGVAGLK